MQPEGEFGDLDGFGVDVDAVDIVGEDGADDVVLVEEAGVSLDTGLFGHDPPVFINEPVKGLDEERTGAAGGIDNAQAVEPGAVLAKEVEPGGRGGRGASAVVLVGAVFGDSGFIGGGEQGETEFGADVVEAGADGVFDDVAGDPFGGVVDAVAFALGEAVEREASIGLGLHDLEFGDGLLEDASKGVEADGALAGFAGEAEVVGPGEVEQRAGVFEDMAGLAGGAEDFGRDFQGIEFGVDLEQAAVEAVDGVGSEGTALAHGPEQVAHGVPGAAALGVVEAALAFLYQQVAQHFGRVAQDAAHILAEEDEDAAVEKALGEADELTAGAGKIGVGLDEGSEDELAKIVVFAVKGLLDGFFAGDLVAQEAVEAGGAVFGQQQIRLEEPPEEKAAEGGGGVIGQQAGIGTAAADEEALALGFAETADIEA